MVQTDNVVQLSGSRQALNPPGIVGLRHLFPVVNWVAPELTVRGEGIRGAARHLFRMAAFVQLEEFRICPHVRRIQWHVNGNVADNADALGIGVAAQSLPLPVKFVLNKVLQPDLIGQLPALFRQRVGLAQTQGFRPVQPWLAAQGVLQRREQSIVFQPAPVLLHESLIGTIWREALKRLPQHVHPMSVHGSKIHPRRIAAPWNVLDFLFFQQSLVCQPVQIDEIMVARAGAQRLIGGIAVAGGSQGQDLPVPLSGPDQKVHKGIGVLPHGADAVRGRQGGNMHQNSAFAHCNGLLN